MIAKTAATLKNGSDDAAEDWKSFAATALALLKGYPLHEVPIMRWVVGINLEAAEARWRDRDLPDDLTEIGETPRAESDLPVEMIKLVPARRAELKSLMKTSGMDITPTWLDGYLMATVVAPKLINPSEWLGGLLHQSNNFTSEDKLQRFLDLVIQRYNAMNAETVDPSAGKLQTNAQDEAALRRWSAGFTEGVLRHNSKGPAKVTKKDDKTILKLIADIAAGQNVARELKSVLPA